MIFGHQHGDAEVDAENVFVVPASHGIERIDETVAVPGFVAVASADVAQHTHAVAEQEWQRATGRARNHRSIEWPLRRGAAPRCVSANVVGSGDTPEVFAVSRILVAQ